MSKKPVKVIDADVNILGVINQFGQPLPTIVSVGNYASREIFPEEGQEGVIYIDASKNIMYRWDLTLSDYVMLAGYGYKTVDKESDIVYTFENKIDKTYTEPAASILLKIPAEVDQGFEAGCVIKTGDIIPTFSIINESSFPLKLIQFGTVRTSYTPATNATITLLLYNDKINNNLLVYEVADA